MKAFLKWLLIGVIALAVALVLARNFIAREAIQAGATKITGFPLQIGSVSVGLIDGQVDVHDIKLMNPPEYPDNRFVEMPELFIDYRLGSMLHGVPHINNMRINIQQLVVVKTAKGDSNAAKLKGIVMSGNSSTKYQIDLLRIHIGTVTLKDFSRGKPTERDYAINRDVTYKNISDSTDISRLVMLTVVSQVPLPDIGVTANDLKKSLGGVQNIANQALSGATNALGGLFKSLNQKQ